MKIRQQVNLFILTLLISLTIALVTSGYYAISRIVLQDSTTVFSRELNNIDLNIHQSYMELTDTGLIGLESYVTAEKQRLQEVLKSYKFGKTGQLYMLDQNCNTILSGSVPEGASYNKEYFKQMHETRNGRIRYKNEGQPYFAVFQHASHWNWLLVLTIDETELFATRNFYLALTLGFSVVCFVLVALFSLRLSRIFQQRINPTLECLHKVEKGNLNARIASPRSDEIGSIQIGINDMIDTVSTKAEELKASNRALQSEITERLRIESALQEVKEAAEDANQAKSIFLSNMSHEIRTPMNAILGFTEILKNKELDPEKLRFLNTIYRSGNSLLSLINDILDLSKIESGKLELQYSPVSIKDLFNEMKTIFNQKISEKELDLIIEFGEGFFAKLLLDENRLRQILINLIGNSVKFTDNGYIRITAYSRPTKQKSNSSVDLTIKVQDTGIGIPEDQQNNIFDAFEQGKGQKDYNSFGGTGLGLAISRHLVEIMNGTISLSSETGKGTTFCIVLKDVEIAALKQTEQIETKAINIDKIQFEPASILIVDDIDFNQEMLALYLEGCDFKITFAKNGREAIDQAAKHSPDIITLDMKMPEMDGYQVIEILNQDERLNSIPVIAITASALKEDEELLTKLCNGYLRKPVSRADLVLELMKHLPYTVDETKEKEIKIAKHLEKTSPTEMIFPPSEEINKLIHAAQMGSITDLKECIADIKSIGLQYQPFVDKIEAWSHTYDFDKIVEFLEKQIGKT